MKTFKSGLLGIFLIMIAMVYPLHGNLDDSSVEKLQQIIALSNQKTEKTQKKKNIVKKIYCKAKKIAKKPYVKKLFYGALFVTICILATYASYDEMLAKPIKELKLIPNDKELESLPAENQEILVQKSNPVLKNFQGNQPLISEVAHKQVPTKPDHQDNSPLITTPNIGHLNTNATVEVVSEQTPRVHSILANPIAPQENHDPKQIPADIVDANVKNPIIPEPQKVSDGDDIDKKKKRYDELRWEDDLDFDQYHEFTRLRDELSKKGLL